MNTLKQTLDLRKELVLDLKKSKGLENQKAAVVLSLDFSGSMGNLYRTGKVQKLVERILPLGLAFDDNGEVDFFLFDDDVKKMPANITLNNVENYINNKVIGKYTMGGTNYSPVINRIVQVFGRSTKAGLFSISKSKPAILDYPVYVIFITDGNNGDKSEATSAIIEASKHGIFFQFIGIGKEEFRFLQKLDTMSGRNIDNANFFKVDDLEQKTDAELYQLLLTEFPSFITEARSKQMIK